MWHGKVHIWNLIFPAQLACDPLAPTYEERAFSQQPLSNFRASETNCPTNAGKGEHSQGYVTRLLAGCQKAHVALDLERLTAGNQKEASTVSIPLALVLWFSLRQVLKADSCPHTRGTDMNVGQFLVPFKWAGCVKLEYAGLSLFFF